MIIENNGDKIILRLDKKDIEMYAIDFYDFEIQSEKIINLLDEWLSIAEIDYDKLNKNQEIIVKTMLKKDEYIIEIYLGINNNKQRYKILQIKKKKIKFRYKIFILSKENDIHQLIKLIPKLNYQIYKFYGSYCMFIFISYIPRKLRLILTEYSEIFKSNDYIAAKIKEEGKLVTRNFLA